MNIKEALLQQVPSRRPSLDVSTGLSLLNIALTGDSSRGVRAGSVIWVSGSPNSGRTTLGISLLTEIAHNHCFDDYGLVYYDDLLHGSLSYGYIDSAYTDRLEHRHLDTVESFWDDVDDLFTSVVILDSMDVLMALSPTSEEDAWKINNRRVARAFRHIRDTESILIITSREKKSCGKMVSAGGGAIPSYADYWLRTHNSGSIFQEMNGKNRLVGTKSSITVIKSPEGKGGVSIPAPIYSNSGYDDAESVVKYLWLERKIKKTDNGYQFGVEIFPSLHDVADRVRENPEEWIALAKAVLTRGLGSSYRTDDF